MNSNAQTISVVIPTYNRDFSIRSAIDSVLNQTYPPFEVIVVDDGSTDETSSIVKFYGQRVRLISQRNSGVSAARNSGILAAQGNWIGFLDSDDEWLADKLQKQIVAISKDTTIVACVANALIITPNKEIIDFFSLKGASYGTNKFQLLERPLVEIICNQPFVQSMLARRSALIRANLFDTGMSIHEDGDLMCRLALQGPFIFMQEPVVRVCRKGDPKNTLSIQYQIDPINYAQMHIQAYRKLLANENLLGYEKKVVRSKLSDQLVIQAKHFCEAQQKRTARKKYLESLFVYPSMKSILRAIYYLIFGSKAIIILRKLKKEKNEEFRRSECDLKINKKNIF
jgi:glycosyltransferase involved in cell wall biosynthesis